MFREAYRRFLETEVAPRMPEFRDDHEDQHHPSPDDRCHALRNRAHRHDALSRQKGHEPLRVAADFTDAVQVGSNHDGDSDSTAAIAAQIFGTWKGTGEIPNAWVRRLDVLGPLLDVSSQLIRLNARQ